MLCLAILLVPALAADQPGVNDIVRKAISREVNNQKRLANYTWERKSVARMLGNSEELKKTAGNRLATVRNEPCATGVQ